MRLEVCVACGLTVKLTFKTGVALATEGDGRGWCGALGVVVIASVTFAIQLP